MFFITMIAAEIITAIRQHNELIDIFIYIIILSIVMVIGVFEWMRFVKNMCVMNLFDKRRAVGMRSDYGGYADITCRGRQSHGLNTEIMRELLKRTG